MKKTLLTLTLPAAAFKSRPLFIALLAGCFIAIFPGNQVLAQDTRIFGEWVINEEFSDSTDDRVEAALRASGARVSRPFFNNDKEYYRGGPAEQELYDQISYEKHLEIRGDGTEYRFTYGGDFHRRIYLGNQSRSTSLNNMNQAEDFSFANWADGTLIVEARPRDGGFTDERYTLSEDGGQLTASFYLKPQALGTAVEITRVYEKSPPEN